MALQKTGQISLSNIRSEFPLADTSTNINLSSFYRKSTGGMSTYYHNGTSGIPTSGEISLSDFYAASALEYVNYYVDGSSSFAPIENTLTLDFSGYVGAVSVIVVIGNENNTDCVNFLNELYNNNVNNWVNSIGVKGSGSGGTNVSGIGYISSSNSSKAGLEIRNVPAGSFIWIKNYGFIVGAGGNGAPPTVSFDDPLANYYAPLSGRDGYTGSYGLSCVLIDPDADILIDNYGAIAGGVGGGASGGDGGYSPVPGSGFSQYSVDIFYNSSSVSITEPAYFDTTTNISTIPNAHIYFLLKNTNTYAGSDQAWIDYYLFYYVRLRGNTYHMMFKQQGSSPVLGNPSGTSTSYIEPVNMSALTQTQFDVNVVPLRPPTTVSVDSISFTCSSPLRGEFISLSGNNVLPIGSSTWGDIKNATNESGQKFYEVLTRFVQLNTAGDARLIQTVGGPVYTLWYYKKGFRTLTTSELYTGVYRGGAGSAGAHFKNYTPSVTTINSSAAEPRQTSTSTGTKVITSNGSNALFHPNFYPGASGAGVKGNYWTNITGGASPSLEVATVTSTSDNDGLAGSGGFPGDVAGDQGGQQAAIFGSGSNIILNNL